MFEIFDSGIFGSRNMASIFVRLELSRHFRRDFWGIQNNLSGSACIFRPHSSAHKVQPNLFCCFDI